MKKFIVIALAVSGNGNKVFKSGDKVTEKNFPPGNTADLVKNGFLAVDESADETDADLIDETLETALQAEKDQCVALGIEIPANATLDILKELIEKFNAELSAALENLKSICNEKGIDYNATDDADTLKSLIAEHELQELKSQCLTNGIEFDADADSETLKGLLADFETAKDNGAAAELETVKATCVENSIEFPEGADAETLKGLIRNFEDANVIAGFTGKEFVTEKGEKKLVLKIDDITVKQLCAELKAANVEFDSQSKKTSLFVQWVKL
jgi:hypothetical protein